MATKRKAMTVRLPEELYRTSSKVARRRRISLNELVKESLEAALKAERERGLYEAFGQAGEDVEGADVEFARAAQQEVVRRGDS